MNISTQEYKKMSKKAVPRSPLFTNCLKAFLIGGCICTIGQVITDLASYSGLEQKQASLCATLALIFLSVALTGFGVYDNIAKHAGAGTIVPVTGFANAVASPALEFKSEGYVLGLGAKMFTVAGPVIVYGVIASVIYGVFYWISTLF